MIKESTKAWLMEQFGANEEVVIEAWNEYLRSTTERIEAARAALAAQDYTQLDVIAHTLKGNAMTMGDEATLAASLALRDDAKASDAAAAAKAIEALEKCDRENRA